MALCGRFWLRLLSNVRNLTPQAPVTPQQLVERTAQRGVVLDADGTRRFRLVTHAWVSAEDVATTVAAFKAVLAA